MSKSYKIKLNQGPGEAKFMDIPSSRASGTPVTIKAVPGGKYQLVDSTTGYAPENIRANRAGKNLQVFFEGRGQPDLVIEDYYAEAPEGFNGLIGESESGRFYEYIPETAAGNSAVPLLADGSNQVGMALGGAEINASGAAVGALVAAAGLNPFLLAPLALLGAAGGGDGGGEGAGGAATDTTPPKIDSAQLLPEDDTGPKDNVTSDKTPRITVKTEPNTDVSVEVNGKIYAGKADKDGVAVVQIPDAGALADGKYTPKVTATDAAGNKITVDGTPFTIDTRGPGDPTDPNNGFGMDDLKILGNGDTGVSNTDFITKAGGTLDDLLIFGGALKGKSGPYDVQKGGGVWVQVFGKSGNIVTQGNATIDGSNNWSFSTKAEIPEGNYTVKATLLDQASNRVDAIDQLLVIDRSVSVNDPKFKGGSTIEEYFVSAKEVGIYSLKSSTSNNEQINIEKNYLGGYFDLNELKEKEFGLRDNFNLIFKDLAGNEVQVKNPLNLYKFSPNANLSKAPDDENPLPLSKPGFVSDHPTTRGNVGEFKFSGASEFDMSTLYDGISTLQKPILNNVDLTISGKQTINLSVQDVLALGVENSFLSAGAHDGKIQMRIDGGSGDIVKLSNEFGAEGSGKWTINPDTTVQLQGIVGDYFQATNSFSGLEVFIKKGVEVQIL